MRKDLPKGAYTSLDITNPAKQLIAEKLQFFADCLQLICLKSGEFYHYEVENHLTLLRNLKFYADGEINAINPQLHRTKNSIRQIQFIVGTHPLFNQKDEIINSDESRAIQINCQLTLVKDEPDLSKENLINIRKYLKFIEVILSPTYIEDVILSLYEKVSCKHQLNYHKSDFEYIARLVFSYFHSEGHSRERIHGLVYRLLAKKMTRKGDRIYTDSPIRKELHERLINHNRNSQPFDQKLFDDIQDYLDKRTLKQQIDGFVHLSEYDKYPFTFIFRIDGLMTWSQKFEILGLKFISITEFVAQFSEEQLNYAKDFFTRSNHSILVEVNVDTYSHDEAVHVAIGNLREKLEIVASRIGGRFSINQTGYTFYPAKQKELWINSMPECGDISEHDIENIEYFERNLSISSHKEFYIQLENILTKAYIEDNVNVSLHHLRKFMQVLFDNIDTTGIDHLNGISDEIRVLCYVLTQFEKERYITETHLWAINMAINNSVLMDEDGESKKLKDQIRVRGTIPLNVLIGSNAKEHVKFEARRARYFTRKVDAQNVFNYYARQLLFIKQYRDKHEHASSLDNQIARKMNLFAYKLMKRLLDCSFKELNREENIGLSHQEILRRVTEKGRSKVGL